MMGIQTLATWCAQKALQSFSPLWGKINTRQQCWRALRWTDWFASAQKRKSCRCQPFFLLQTDFGVGEFWNWIGSSARCIIHDWGLISNLPLLCLRGRFRPCGGVRCISHLRSLSSLLCLYRRGGGESCFAQQHLQKSLSRFQHTRAPY